VAQYAVTRLVCHLGVPPDCHLYEDDLQELHTFQVMLSLGFVLAVLTGVHIPERHGYLFRFRCPKPRGFVFLAVFLGSGPVFGSFDLVPFLEVLTLTPSGIGHTSVMLLIPLLVAGAALVLWHFVYAFKRYTIEGFLVYAGVRLAVWSFYGLYLFVAQFTRRGEYQLSFHLHHYVLAFMLALLAEFNHPLSLLLLAAGSGIFVQGLAAYGSLAGMDVRVAAPLHRAAGGI